MLSDINNRNHHDNNGIHPVDEGWWESILAEEPLQEQLAKEYVSHTKRFSPDMADVDWDYAQGLFQNDGIVELQVSGYNRGGLLVEGQDIRGFVPVSHLVDFPDAKDENKRQEFLSGYLEDTIRLKVIECEPLKERIVLSERAALSGEGQRILILDTLEVGEVVSGLVTNITEFGVFVDLGGVEGLVHVSELSWGRVQHPADIMEVGQTVQAKVLSVCKESGRVAMSYKQLSHNPWSTITQHRRPGDVVTATITAIKPYGVFARLEEGIEGLIHVSSVDSLDETENLAEFFHPGQAVNVCILHIDTDRRRLGLSLVYQE